MIEELYEQSGSEVQVFLSNRTSVNQLRHNAMRNSECTMDGIEIIIPELRQ